MATTNDFYKAKYENQYELKRTEFDLFEKARPARILASRLTELAQSVTTSGNPSHTKPADQPKTDLFTKGLLTFGHVKTIWTHLSDLISLFRKKA